MRRGNTGFVGKSPRRAIDRKVDVAMFLASPAGQRVTGADADRLATQYGVKIDVVRDCLRQFGRSL